MDKLNTFRLLIQMFIEIITHVAILGICANSLLVGTHKNAFYFVWLLLYIIIIIKYKIELTQIINFKFYSQEKWWYCFFICTR